MLYNKMEVLTFVEFEQKNYLRAKKCSDIYRTHTDKFVEGVDYFMPTRKEIGQTGGNTSAKIYLLTKAGQDKMKDLCNQSQTRKKKEPKSEDNTPIIANSELSTESILLQILESQKVFQETMLKSFQTMANLLVNMNMQSSEPAPAPAEEVDTDYENYRTAIKELMEKILKETSISNKNTLKQLVKGKMDKDYGICTAQCKADFYRKENRYPESDIELFYWIEKSNTNLKGIVQSILSTYLMISSPQFPVRDVDELRMALEYIATKTKDNSINHSNTYRRYFDYVNAHTDIKWEKFENKIRLKYRKSSLARITKMECLECPIVKKKCIPLFNQYVEEKYKNLFT